jgi:hypothetical protein
MPANEHTAELAAEITAIDADVVVEPAPTAKPAILLATPASASADDSSEDR